MEYDLVSRQLKKARDHIRFAESMMDMGLDTSFWAHMNSYSVTIRWLAREYPVLEIPKDLPTPSTHIYFGPLE